VGGAPRGVRTGLDQALPGDAWQQQL